jgi:regulator of replication initiation timing
VDALQARQHSLSVGAGNIAGRLGALETQVLQLDQSVKSLGETTAKNTAENTNGSRALNEALAETEKAISGIVAQAKKDKQETYEGIVNISSQVNGMFETVNKLLKWAYRDAAATKTSDIGETS